ncbi:MAG: class I SAM-dependent methyltransferase [Phycisphaerae bacterium]|nr:class I SAM-dependent methyltransferase [Phycisphaerae bacterium]
MARRRRSGNQRYHDRVAGRYESIYDDAYWQWHDTLTWEHLKRLIPADLSSPVADLGCGSGKWGRRLLKSGYRVTFVDLSAKMLDEARRQVEEMGVADKAEFIQADLADLSALPEGHFGLAMAMGEPIGLTESPQHAMRQITRCLASGGVLVATLDNRVPCVDYYLEKGDREGLERFVRSGRTHWLTRDPSEQFEIHTFEPKGVERLVAEAGLTMLDMIGKTVLPMRHHRELIEDATERRRWVKIEQRLAGDPANFGRCAHLQFAARKP